MKKTLTMLIAFLVLLPVFCSVAYADTGPKPSVLIRFTGCQDTPFYATLLSEDKSTGPDSAWDGRPEFARYSPGEDGYEIWKKFVDYQDTDGYFFLQNFWDCTESHTLDWTYYPPSPFKILVYFPESDSFLASPIYERYAFHSTYTVDLAAAEDGVIAAKEDWHWETISFAFRIIFTVAVELVIALLFGYKQKKVLLLISAANLVTQLLLNLFLNSAMRMTVILFLVLPVYLIAEAIVCALEAVAYKKLFPKLGAPARARGGPVAYAIAANAASFILGVALALVLPGPY